MQATKLRPVADGLIPAGAYFKLIAENLRDANARDAARQAALDEEDRRLERRYARRSSAGARASV